jgi:hypothetical protein
MFDIGFFEASDDMIDLLSSFRSAPAGNGHLGDKYGDYKNSRGEASNCTPGSAACNIESVLRLLL